MEVTSTVRNLGDDGSPTWDFHVGHQAADFARPMNSLGNIAMKNCALFWYEYSPYLLELIHTTPYADDNGMYVKYGDRVPPSYYGDEVGFHLNHVHVAATRAKAKALFDYLQKKYTIVVNDRLHGGWMA